MSKIDELIYELCPEGVVFKHLWEITVWDKRFSSVEKAKQTKTIKYPHVSAKKLKEIEAIGDVKLLSTGKFDGWTNEERAGSNLGQGEVITVPSGGSANLKYWSGKFVDSGNLLGACLDSNKYSLKYIYYFLQSKNNFLESCFRGSGVKHPDMGQILDIKVPVPPITVQDEIVKILDKFMQLEMELTSNLATELAARKVQHDHYRNQLLSFDNAAGIRRATLGEICKITRGRVISKDFLSQNAGTFPVYSSQTANNGIFGRINSYDYDIESITWTTDGANAGSVFYHNNEKFSITNVCGLLEVRSEGVSTRFLYYALQMLTKSYVNAGMGNPKLMSNVMATIKVAIPSLAEQNRVVSILDEFDALSNDISGDLQDEIMARRQQYEYYRNKLLTFKELSV